MRHGRGAVWTKWDLHVHTPASIVHNYPGSEDDAWDFFLADLQNLSPEFKVIGINDYIFLDGYRRVLEARNQGKLKNLDLVLPVIELRLDRFGGSNSKLSRLNYHVIFSDELSPDVIRDHFLNALPRNYKLSALAADAAGPDWRALPTKESLADLGTKIIESVPEKERAKFKSPIEEGFNNWCVSLEGIEQALQSHYFKDMFVTAVGKTEWSDIKWNDQSIAEKKSVINGAHLVFTSATSEEALRKSKQVLQRERVNSRLLDCSDAHWLQQRPDR